MFACIYLTAEGDPRKLADCAARFAPEAELTAPDTVLFDVSRLNLLYGSLEQIAEAIARHARSLGLNVNVGIGPNAETAILAARHFRGVTVMPEDSAAALARLDIENLPL